MGAARGTLRPDPANIRKKGTGNPILVPKTEGKRQSFSSVNAERLLSRLGLGSQTLNAYYDL